MKRLELPPSLQTYWEDCLYSEYRDANGKTDYSKITRALTEQKSLPELPCDAYMLWDGDGNGNNGNNNNNLWFQVVIRIHARFASKELFDYAAKNAFETVRFQLKDYSPHPICAYLRGGRPRSKEDIAIECARLKDKVGWTYEKIGENYGWKLQRDSYGNLNQCSTARYYVKLGRILENTNQKPAS